MRSLVAAVTLLLCFGAFVTLAASAELPLMPPVDQVPTPSDSAQEEEAAAAAAAVPGMMSRLIRLYFRDQVRWWPFLDWSEECAHHRVVREYRRGVKLPDVVQFHLRGSPVEAPAARGS